MYRQQMFHTVGLFSEFAWTTFYWTRILRYSEMFSQMSLQSVLSSESSLALHTFVVCFSSFPFVGPREMITWLIKCLLFIQIDIDTKFSKHNFIWLRLLKGCWEVHRHLLSDIWIFYFIRQVLLLAFRRLLWYSAFVLF